MPDLKQLEIALRNADNAGDTLAAQQLVKAIKTETSKPDVNSLARGFNQKYGVHPFFGVPEEYDTSSHLVSQGAGMMFGDEINAAGAAAVAKAKSLFNDNEVDLSKAYGEALEAQNRQRKEYVKNNPVKAIAAEIGGGLVSVGGAVNRGVTFMKNAKTLPALMRTGAADGALYGSVAGAGHAESGLPNRLTGLFSGLGAGTLMGVAAPVVLSSGSALGRLFKNKLTAMFGNPANQANTRINQTMRQAGLTADDVKRTMNNLGSEASVIDALGEQGNALARSTANTSPEARKILQDMSNMRMAGQPDRLNNKLSEAANLEQIYSPNELRQMVRDTAKPDINSAYEAAVEAGKDLDETQLNDLLQSDLVNKAYKKGEKLARERMIANKQALANSATELNSLNPTGSSHVKYNPLPRAMNKLGPNITTLNKTKGINADDNITIYRGTLPGVDDIKPGDYVTTNKQLAHDYSEGNVINRNVKASDLLDDISEPLGEEYIYRPPLDRAPSRLAIWDETKKTLDAMAQPSLGQPPTNQQAIAASLAKQLRSNIDDGLPEYADARSLAKNLFEQERAIDLGEKLARTHTHDVIQDIDKIAPGNRMYVGQGFATKKIDQLNNRRTTPGAIDALFGSKNQQDAIRIAFGEEAQLLHNQLAAERAFANTHRNLIGNSTTARQLYEMGFPGRLESLAALVRKGGNVLTAKREEQVAPWVAKILTGSELPKGVGEGINKNPALQKLIIRMLSQQTGGNVGEAVTAGP